MNLGFCLSGNVSNDGSFFDERTPDGVICEECGTCLDLNYYPEYIEIHRSKKYDISYTHDLRTLYSENFVQFCRDELRCNEDFIKISTGHFNYYYMVPNSIVEFDSVRRETKFVGPCKSCGGFRDIAGAHPVFLKECAQLGNGFFRTNIHFASGKSKHFLTLTSVEWAEKLKGQKFRGLSLEAISS